MDSKPHTIVHNPAPVTNPAARFNAKLFVPKNDFPKQGQRPKRWFAGFLRLKTKKRPAAI
jgi:hypothetical protein